MDIGLFFLSFVTNMFCFYYDYKNKNTFLFIWLLNIIFVFYPISIDVFSESSYGVSSALMFITICNLMYLMSSFFFRFAFHRKKAYKVDFGGLGVSRAYWYVVIIISISIPLIFLMKGVGLSTILSSDLSTKRQLGVFYLLIILSCAFVFPNVILFYKQRKLISMLFLVALFFLVLLFFRSRSVLSYIALPIAFYLLYNTKYGLFKLAIFGFFAYFFSQLVKVIRYQGALSDGLDVSRWPDSFSYVTKNSIESGDLSIYNVFFDIVRDCDTTSWCGSWTYINKIASWVIPGLEKNKTIEYLLYDSYVQAGVGGSLHPLSYGVAYAEGGGILGVVYFIFLALLSEVNGRMIEKSFYIFSGFSMYFCLFFSRGSVYNGLFVLAVGVLLYLVIMMFGVKNERYKII